MSLPRASRTAAPSHGALGLGLDRISARIVLVLAHVAALAVANVVQCDVDGTECDECVELQPEAARGSMQRLQVRGTPVRCQSIPD